MTNNVPQEVVLASGDERNNFIERQTNAETTEASSQEEGNSSASAPSSVLTFPTTSSEDHTIGTVPLDSSRNKRPRRYICAMVDCHGQNHHSASNVGSFTVKMEVVDKMVQK